MENETEGQAPDRLLEKPTWLISQLAIRTRRMLSDAFEGAGVRGHHYRVLASLEQFGPSSQVAIGQHAGLDRSDVAAAVNELAASGAVKRTEDPEDRRRNIVSLTPEGRVQLKQVEKVVARVQDQMMAPLSSAERERTVRALRQMLDESGSV